MSQLYSVRVRAFLVHAGALIGMSLLVAILSADFRGLVMEHFGKTFLTEAAMLVITGIASHLHNVLALKKLGARTEDTLLI